jgi:hypothetical protein
MRAEQNRKCFDYSSVSQNEDGGSDDRPTDIEDGDEEVFVDYTVGLPVGSVVWRDENSGVASQGMELQVFLRTPV